VGEGAKRPTYGRVRAAASIPAHSISLAGGAPARSIYTARSGEAPPGTAPVAPGEKTMIEIRCCDGAGSGCGAFDGGARVAAARVFAAH